MIILASFLVIWFMANLAFFMDGLIDASYCFIRQELIIKRIHLIFPGYVIGYKLQRFLDKPLKKGKE